MTPDTSLTENPAVIDVSFEIPPATFVLCEHCNDGVEAIGDHYHHVWLDPSPMLKHAVESGWIDPKMTRYCCVGPWEARHGREAVSADYEFTYEAMPRVS